MNPNSNTPSSRSVIRACIIATLFLVGCTQTIQPTATIPPVGETQTAAPTVTAAPTLTRTLVPTATITPSPTISPSPTPTLTPTDTATFTPSASPTITLTPLPTWTAYQVDMFYPQSERLVLDPKNPQQNCFISYFDLTLTPGYIGVWKRDNGGYLICVQKAGSQP